MSQPEPAQQRPLVSVVIAAHGDCRELALLLYSFFLQRKYGIGVTETGETIRYAAAEWIKPSIETIAVWDGEAREALASAADVTTIVPKADPPCCGHNTRTDGILAATGQWIVLTNADNYYCNGWYHSLKSAIDHHPTAAMITWNCVNNLWGWDARPSSLKEGGIDMGCVAVRADIAKKVLFPFRRYSGDWDYIEACLREVSAQQLNVWHIPETLFVHN